jgi:tRNA-Thr(GGU) m(6)t(6)A37 methyltransferase TsaA
MFDIRIVGKIHSGIRKIEDCPLQESEGAPPARIEILPDFLDAAKDIKKGDDLILLTWLGLADRSTLTTFPRNDPRNGLTGVFSTRSPHRPNPIGFHKVRVLAVESDGAILVSALEVVDQTPVVDIKSA